MYRGVHSGSGRFAAASGTNDSYLNKLVKYVPVEGLAPFLPLATVVANEDALLVVTFVVALLLGLLLIAVQVKEAAEKPRAWFWPFVVIAFIAWSVGASQEFREMLGVSQAIGGWLLGLTAAALPAFDSGLEKLRPR